MDRSRVHLYAEGVDGVEVIHVVYAVYRGAIRFGVSG